MAKYRKKPVVIEAFQWDGTIAMQDWPLWLKAQSHRLQYVGDKKAGAPVLVIPTLEGNMKAQEGDWIIQGVTGEIYPCKPDIFEATYEPA